MTSSVPVKERMIAWLGPVVWEYLASTEGMVSIVDTHGWLARPGTVGRPFPDTTVRILDDGAEVPVGEPGTIYFGVPGQAPPFEYLHDPEKTAAGWHGDLVTAGDYGYLDEDGYLFLLDRRTDLIISGGVNIAGAGSDAVTGRVFVVGGGQIGVAEAWRLGPEMTKDGIWSADELAAAVPELLAKAAPNVDMMGRPV